jgi:inorganic pyrophosphatase
MSASLIALPTYRSRGILHVIVEIPRGSRAKIAYDEALETFSISHGLPVELAYRGFIPGPRPMTGATAARKAATGG